MYTGFVTYSAGITWGLGPGFNFRKYHIRGGGGIFITVLENLIVEALPDMDSNCEITWFKVRLTTSKFVIFVVFYTGRDPHTFLKQQKRHGVSS